MKKAITTILLPLLILSCGKESSSPPETIVKTVLVKPDTKISKQGKKEEVQKYFSQDISYTCDDSENCNDQIGLISIKKNSNIQHCIGLFTSNFTVIVNQDCTSNFPKDIEVKSLSGKISSVKALSKLTDIDGTNFLTLNLNEEIVINNIEHFTTKTDQEKSVTSFYIDQSKRNPTLKSEKCDITYNSLYAPYSNSINSKIQALKGCTRINSINLISGKPFSISYSKVQDYKIIKSYNLSCNKDSNCSYSKKNLSKLIIYKFIRHFKNTNSKFIASKLLHDFFKLKSSKLTKVLTPLVYLNLESNELIVKTNKCFRGRPLGTFMNTFYSSFNLNIFGEIESVTNKEFNQFYYLSPFSKVQVLNSFDNTFTKIYLNVDSILPSTNKLNPTYTMIRHSSNFILLKDYEFYTLDPIFANLTEEDISFMNYVDNEKVDFKICGDANEFKLAGFIVK